MMNIAKKIGNGLMLLFAITSISFYYNTAMASSDIRTVKVIEFKNLYYLSKYEIIDKVNVTIKGKDIIIDIDTLEKALQENSLVKSFRISENQGRLTVTVDENEPVFLLALKKGEKLIPFELDGNYRIISLSRVHAFNMPLIVVTEDEMKEEEPSSGLKNLLAMLKGFSDDDLSKLLREISEIDLTDMHKARILLNGRRTAFLMEPTKDNFYKLNYSVGYFDRIRYYPETFVIADGQGIIK